MAYIRLEFYSTKIHLYKDRKENKLTIFFPILCDNSYNNLTLLEKGKDFFVNNFLLTSNIKNLNT